MIAKPLAALLPLRTTPAAFISSTAANSATAIQPAQDGQGPPLSVTGKPRREVPLPSQEKKEGAMQYALYVASAIYSDYFEFIFNRYFLPANIVTSHLEQLLTKWRTGHVKALSGR
jgi:hypothetical protein